MPGPPFHGSGFTPCCVSRVPYGNFVPETRGILRDFLDFSGENRYNKKQSEISDFLSRCSAVGSAPALGAGCREFESLHLDQAEPGRNSRSGLECFLFSNRPAARSAFSWGSRAGQAEPGCNSRSRLGVFALTNTASGTAADATAASHAGAGFLLSARFCAGGGLPFEGKNQ